MINAKSGGNVGIWIVSPAYVRRLSAKLPREDIEWCYFGFKAGPKKEASRWLEGVPKITLAGELDRAAGVVKQPFLDWIADLGERQTDKLNWWASAFAAKIPSQTDCFSLVCYAQVAGSWIAAAPRQKIRLIVIEDPWLVWMLRKRFSNETGVSFYGHSAPYYLLDAAYRLARGLFARAYFVVWALSKTFAGRLFKIGRKTTELEDHRHKSVLIFTWIEQACFSMPGKLTDRFTGHLDEILSRHGERVKRLTYTSVPRVFLKRLKNFSSSLVMTQEFIGILDIFRCAIAWFRIDSLKNLPEFLGWNLTPLLYRELVHQWGNTGFSRNSLWRLTQRRIAERLGSRIKCIIYPFENQPWEKLLCLAWRDKAPQVKLVGYQHSSIPALWLGYFLGRGEDKIMPIPDLIVTNGNFYLETLKKGGFPADRLINGGALRYEYLHNMTPSAHSQFIFSAQKFDAAAKKVLVVLPYWPVYARSLFEDLLDEFNVPLSSDGSGETPVRFEVKCHPFLPVSKFYGNSLKLPPWITISLQSLDKALADAHLMLYIPPTTCWWEALFTGIPILKYQADLLDIDGDARDVLGESAIAVCSRATLRSSIEAILRQAKAASRLSGGVLENVYGRVKEDAWFEAIKANVNS